MLLPSAFGDESSRPSQEDLRSLSGPLTNDGMIDDDAGSIEELPAPRREAAGEQDSAAANEAEADAEPTRAKEKWQREANQHYGQDDPQALNPMMLEAPRSRYVDPAMQFAPNTVVTQLPAQAFVTQNHGGHAYNTASCQCGQCMACADRNGEGMIGGLGMKLGVGPKCEDDCQCWQCPYDAPFSVYGAGEYAGPARTHRIGQYRLRTGDTISMTFLITELKSDGAYRLVVGDELLIESEADEELTRGTLERGLKIQPDGTITLRLIGQIYAAGQTVDQLREVLEEKYTEFYPEPAIDVTPVNTGSAAQKIRDAISGAGGFDPQQVAQTVTPSGEIRLPKIGSVMAQGLTLDELKQEINLRYDQRVGGLEVEPSLQSQAPHNVFVLGEVRTPGRFNLENTPTTVLGAIAMAGGHVPGANLRQVVIFRRGDNWELISTLVDVRGAILGREAHPADEIWIRDGDVIILPSTPIRLFDNFVRQVFTEGIYGILPVTGSYNFGSSFQ